MGVRGVLGNTDEKRFPTAVHAVTVIYRMHSSDLSRVSPLSLVATTVGLPAHSTVSAAESITQTSPSTTQPPTTHAPTLTFL